MSNPKAIFAGLLSLGESFSISPAEKDAINSIRDFLNRVNQRSGSLITSSRGKNNLENVARKIGLVGVKREYDKLFPNPLRSSRKGKKNTIICDQIFQKMITESNSSRLSFWGYGGNNSNKNQLGKEIHAFKLEEFLDSQIPEQWDEEIRDSISYKEVVADKNYETFFGSTILDTQKVYLFDYHIGASAAKELCQTKDTFSKSNPFYNLKWYFDGVSMLCEAINKYSFREKVEVHLFTQYYKFQERDLSQNKKIWVTEKGLGTKLIDLFESLNFGHECNKVSVKVHLLEHWEFEDNDRYIFTDYESFFHHGLNFRSPLKNERKKHDKAFTGFMEKKLGTLDYFFKNPNPETSLNWKNAANDYFYSGVDRSIRGDNIGRVSIDRVTALKGKIPNWLKISNDPKFL